MGKKHIETNGPANIIMFIDVLLSDNKISEQDYQVIKDQALKTVEYLKLLENPDKVNWSDVNTRLYT